ncbi:MAG: hypothetical protein ACI4WW_06300 [Candidatus Coprovivens sp.]
MKLIQKRYIIEHLITNLNSENKVDILNQLKDMTDEEGKNPLIIALEMNDYKAFSIMIQPVDLNGSKKIYFDPFNQCVFECIKPLKWKYNDNHFDREKTYTGMFDTKQKFYSSYSAYSYITHMKNQSLKKALIELCHTIDYDIFSNIHIGDIPNKDKHNNCTIYEEQDVIKYVDLPLQKTFLELLKKNIPIIKWGMNQNEIYIAIQDSLLSEENHLIINILLKKGIVYKNLDMSVISIRYSNNDTLEYLSNIFLSISNLFDYQEVTKGLVDIDSYYKNISLIIKSRGFILPENPTDKDKIHICMKANRKLVQKEDKIFYVHPELKKRNNNALTLKKNQVN